MTSPPEHAPPPPHITTRQLLDEFALGEPNDVLRLGELLSGFGQSCFGLLLFLAVIPAFIPIPGVGGAISGPLVVLVGMQLLLGLSQLWLPGFIKSRGPMRSTMGRFRRAISPWLKRLEKLVKPRLSGILNNRLALCFTGLLLVLLGLLLALPIPFTNYLFAALLLLFALALLERDGALLLVAWLTGGMAVVVFGFLSGHLVQLISTLLARWM